MHILLSAMAPPDPRPETPSDAAAPGEGTLRAGQEKEERGAATVNSLSVAPQLPAPSKAGARQADMPLSVSPAPTNRLVGRFIDDLEADFTRSARLPPEDLPRDMVEAGLTDPTNGQLALHNLRIRKPEAYFRLLGQLIPKEMLVGADSDLGAMLQDLSSRRAATIEGHRAAEVSPNISHDSETQRARVKKRWAKQGKGNIKRDEKGRIVKHIKQVLDEHGAPSPAHGSTGQLASDEHKS